MSRTRKPCPGCHEERDRNSDEVCEDCKKLLQEAIDARARKNRRADTEIVGVPFAAHGFPYIHRIGSDLNTEVRESFFALAELLGSEITERFFGAKTSMVDLSEDRFNNSSPHPWYLPKGLAAITTRLYAAITRGAEVAYEEGKTEGHQLIVGLATGRTSIDEFNAATVGEVANKRRRTRR